MSTETVSLRWDWVAILLLFVVDGVLLLTTNFRMLWRPEFVILAAVIFLQLLGLIYTTLRDAPRLANMANIGSLLVLFTNGTAVLNYILCGVFVMPLRDVQFDAADKMLGLDWLDFYRWTTGHGGFFMANGIIYAMLGPEVIILVVWLESLGRHHRTVAFWRHFGVTALITVGFGILLPAAGPFVLYHLPVALSTGYVAQEMALRAGTIRLIDLGHAEGLVCFPSFHTTLALICAYAARGLKYLAWPALLLNLGIIFSAPVIGGHYFVDIVAGAVLAGVVVALERRLSMPAAV